uniref:Superoxide dismutase copper/zinc binding domain-containing protein n=1 Tax=Pyramimonas obovata TaxID=1411642 RepID=A0A7S0MVC1_9CHLO|mmetsp:Transcript_12944/g.27338  ORF Transcript_12944/g.27338 Transcript_12944/m.27338 type:complete len:1541 (+) Transcript_12944:184-4806(+)
MRHFLVCTSAILVMCGCALVSAQSSLLDDQNSLEVITRSFVVSPESFVYDKLHDLYFYTSRPDTRPLHEGGDRGNNNGQITAFRPDLGEIQTADAVTQNFGFCEEAHGTEIVGDLLYVAAMGQVCVFNTTSFKQLDSIGCCGDSSAFDGHFLQGIAYDPVRNMLWVTDLGAREQEVHNTGDDSDVDAGVTLDLNGKELIAAIDFKAYNDDGTPQIRKTLGFSSTDSDSDSFSRTGEDPLDRTVRFHPNGLAVDPKTGIIYVANTIVKAQEDDEGENEYAAVWTCLPLGEAPCGSEDCEGGFSETFDRTVSCDEIQSTRAVYKAGFNADGLVIDDSGNVIFTAWPSNVQSHKQGDDSDGYKDGNHLDQPGKVFRLVGSAKKSVQFLADGQAEALEADLKSGFGCNSTACDSVSAKVVLTRAKEGAIQLTYRVTNGERNIESGIHVHTGTSCDLPEGLYSDTNPNAWIGITYKTDEFGNSEGSFEIDTGFALEENVGHAVTIHDGKGVALACGILGQGPNQIKLVQPGDLTIDTKRNKLVIPSIDLFNTDSHTYYTVDLSTATWLGYPVQTLETVSHNLPDATIKEFSTSWLSTPNMITYDPKNDRYITTLGSMNRVERKIKIREPDSPFEENGQLSAWNAETSVLVSDLFGGCAQAWDSVVVDDIMYTASFMGWVCVMNLTDFNNGPIIGEKLLVGHNINGIAYDARRNLLWVTESGTQGGNDRITHTLPSAPKDTSTAMIVAIDLATKTVVAQTNVTNENFFPVSLAVDPSTGNLIVGNTVAKIRSSDFGALVECIPDAGLFVTCYGIPTTNTVSATNQIVLGVEIANDGLIYFSAMKPLNQIDPEANLFRLNEDRQLETLVLDLFLACRIEGNPKRRKNAPPAPDAEDVAAVNKFGVNETEGNDSDRWMGFGEESDTDSDGANPDSDKDDDDVDPCLLAQIPSHASFSYDPKRNQLVFPTIEDNTKFTVDLDTAKWIYYRPPTPKREMDLEELAALPGAGALDTDNDISEDSNDHGVDIREHDRDIDSDAWDSDDDKREAEEKEKALQLQREAEIASGVYTAETEAVVERADEDSNEESSEKKEGEEGEDHDERESEDLVEDLLDFKFDKSEVFVPTRVEASVAQLAPFPFAVHSGLVNRTARGVVKLVAGFNKTLVVTYQLVDLDPASRPADPDAAGHLAIHAGLSCDHIGRQLFTQPPNVIESQRLSYHADNLGQASDSISVQTGVSYEDNVGRAFVVYAAGMPPQKPILCGILAPTENSKAYLAPVLEGNDDPFKGTLRGNVTLTPVINPQLGESPIRLAWNVTGAAPNTVGHIHVHDASTCEGIHLLGPDSILQKSADDAEGAAATAFETDAQGQAHGSLEVNSGFGYAANAGKAVTLHDDKDATVACGVLVPQTVQVPCPICILPLDFRLDENSVNDFDRDGESDSPCIDRDTDDSDCQTVDELREEDSDDFNESDEGRTDDDNHNEKRIPDSGWYMVTVFLVVAVLIAVFVKKVFIDTPEEGAGAEAHALLKQPPAEENTYLSKEEKTVDAVV